MRIRLAISTDAPTWARLRQDLWPEADDTHKREVEQYFRGELLEPLAVLLAKSDEGEMIGFAELSIRPDVPGCWSGHVGYLEGLYVVPERRHRGVARALVRASRDWARRQGCGEFASDRAGRFAIDRSYRGTDTGRPRTS